MSQTKSHLNAGILSLLMSLCIMFLTGCENEDPYKFENAIYQCHKEHFEKEGQDIDQIVETLQGELVEENVLEDGSGQSYINFLKMVATDSLTIEGDQTELVSQLYEYSAQTQSITCVDTSIILDSAIFSNSRTAAMFEAFQDASDNFDFGAAVIARSLLKALGPEDFEHHYFKSFFFTYYVQFVYTELLNQGLTRRLPPAKESKPESTPVDSLAVHISEDDELFVDGKKEQTENLRKIVRTFIYNSYAKDSLTKDLAIIGTHKVCNSVITLSNDRGTGYNFYIKAQNEMVAAYGELRNEFSIELFGLKFDEIDEDQKAVIKQIIPMRIVESDPR